MAYKTIRFGLAEVISDHATVGNIPAVTLEPAGSDTGEVGQPGPDMPNDEIRDGSTVLEFHNTGGAEVLIEDIVKALRKSGHNMSEFLYRLSKQA